MNGNTGMGGNQGKWGNNNVGSGDYVKKADCESESSGEGVGNTGNYPKWNHKDNVGTGSGYDTKKHYGGNNNVNTGNYYSNKWNYNNNGNTMITGNPTNSSNGINTKITGPWPKSGKKEETVFVSVNETFYYEYTVTNFDCKIQIRILDQNLKCWEFVFKQNNTMVLIDAIYNIILVQEVDSTGAILSLYVITINYDRYMCAFSIDSFAVNSYVDDGFFYFDKPWYIGEILEYNPIENWIAIIKISADAVDIYKINIDQKINVLLTVGWFKIKNGEVIDGGNSRVLYDKKNDQLLVDTRNCRIGQDDPTVYKRVPICDLVKLPLYKGQGTTVNYVSWYFQYLSKSPCGQYLTTFLYQGYGDLPIINPVSLKSTCPIIYKYDDYSFFAAITDCDIYLTTVDLNEETNTYDVFSGLLSKTCYDAKKRAEIVRDWSQAVEIVFVEGTFYLLTKNKFIVYTDCPAQWNKVYENDCIYSNGDATVTLFRQIKLYLKRK